MQRFRYHFETFFYPYESSPLTKSSSSIKHPISPANSLQQVLTYNAEHNSSSCRLTFINANINFISGKHPASTDSQAPNLNSTAMGQIQCCQPKDPSSHSLKGVLSGMFYSIQYLLRQGIIRQTHRLHSSFQHFVPFPCR